MKHTRHKPEQIIRKLRQAEQMLNEGQAVSDVCRALEVSTWLTDTSPRPLATERVSVHWVGREP